MLRWGHQGLEKCPVSLSSCSQCSKLLVGVNCEPKRSCQKEKHSIKLVRKKKGRRGRPSSLPWLFSLLGAGLPEAGQMGAAAVPRMWPGQTKLGSPQVGPLGLSWGGTPSPAGGSSPSRTQVVPPGGGKPQLPRCISIGHFKPPALPSSGSSPVHFWGDLSGGYPRPGWALLPPGPLSELRSMRGDLQ